MSEFTDSSFGDRIAYDRRGTGPALIFVAGAGPFRAIDPLTSATAELASAHGISTIVYDRLGRGESSADGEIGLERELAALAALVTVAGGTAVLCGHSSGCTIALAATTAGIDVSGLVLWEAPLGGIGGVADWADEVINRLGRNEREGALTHYMKDMPPEWLEGLRQSPIFAQMVDQAPSLQPDAESLSWAEATPLPTLLARIRIPVEAVYGESSMPFMRSAAESIASAIPGATARALPGANHSWEAEPMAQELAEFTLAAAALVPPAPHL